MEGGEIRQCGSPEEIYEQPTGPVRGRLHRGVEPAAG
jgi:hypothetical protein